MSEKDQKIAYRRLSVDEQADMLNNGQPFLYHMNIRFKSDAGMDEINSILEMIGDRGKMVARDAITLHMQQTVPFIPDDEMLAKYAKILEEGYSKKGTTLSNTRFDGYETFYAVMPYVESDNEDAVPAHEEHDLED